MEILAPITIPLGQPEASDYVALLPKGPGVYAFRARNEIIHISWSPHIGTRIARLLSRATSGNGTLGSQMKSSGFVLQCWQTSSRLESALVMYEVLRSECPTDYRRRLRLRLPWFVTLTTRDEFPRLSVVNRVPSGDEPVFGPFTSRDGAQRYADDVVGCFGIRRCAETLVPDPSHPGCIYGEIKQCLRPCQRAVTEADYEAEVQRVYSFLLTNGESNLRTLAAARDEAAQALQFEEAAELHKLIGRVKEIERDRDDLVWDARSFSGIALTHGTGERAFRLWPMVNGLWRQSLQVTVEEDSTPESIAGGLQDPLFSLLADRREIKGDIGEHQAILVRWYYSSSCDGRWYPLRPGSKPSLRRIGKAALQMLKSKEGL